MDTLCRPRWLDDIAAEASQDPFGGAALSSGCATSSWNGGVIYTCPADDMTTMVNDKWGTDFTPDEYALARSTASEVDSQGHSGTFANWVLEKVAIAEANVNWADKWLGGDLVTSLTHHDADGVPYFSRQWGNNPQAATSSDPQWVDIVVARWVIAGKTLDFAGGATQYFAPGEQSSPSPQTVLANRLQNGSWVGRLPGISSYYQMFFTEDGAASADNASAAQDEITTALGPTSTLTDPNSLPTCGVTLQGVVNGIVTTVPGGKITLGIGLVALAGFGWWRWKIRAGG